MAANHRRANHRSAAEAGLTPLSLLIANTSLTKINEVRIRLRETGITELIYRSTTAFMKGHRVAAFLLALELSDRGIAPFFRRHDIALPESSIPISANQEYDLLVYDLIWLMQRYPEHSTLAGVPITWEPHTWRALFRRADALYWLGNRPIWLIVKKLKLSERQQWEARLLKSLPVKRKARGLNQSAQRIYAKLAENLPSIMRTGTDELSARRILQKRKRLWFCAEMCNWSPTETARLYRCMTGETVTKSHVANQLGKITKYRRHHSDCLDEKHDQCNSYL
jgi:hypothetical protein